MLIRRMFISLSEVYTPMNIPFSPPDITQDEVREVTDALLSNRK